jgi:hypothetical protein
MRLSVSWRRAMVGGGVFLLGALPAAEASQVGTFFFYWHDAPGNNFDAEAIIYDPYGGTAPFPGGDTWYSSQDPQWYAREFRDMEYAGMQVALPVNWGDNSPWFNNATIAAMVEGLQRSGSGVRLGLFDDTTSEACDYNQARGLGYTPEPAPPLSDSDGLWFWFYDLKWKSFFNAVPRELWATHNGLPVAQGGRPIVVTYTGAWFSDVEMADEMWGTIKASFVRDFGVEPWLVLETNWFARNPDVATVADGRYAWGAAVGGWNSYEHGGYRVNAVGAGYDDHLIRPDTPTYRARDNGALLSNSWNAMPRGADLILVETWNELWEGSGVSRLVDYPDELAGSGTLDELFYMERVRALTASEPGWGVYRASLVDLQVPERVGPGSILGFTVRNDGTLPWIGSSFRLGSRFMLRADRGDSTLVEVRFGELEPDQVVAPGELASFLYTVPVDWLEIPGPGAWRLQVDMVEEGVTWFAYQGDRAVEVPLIIDATAPAGPALAVTRQEEVLARGSVFHALGRVGNPGDAPHTWQVWVDGALPDGRWVPLLAPVSVPLAAGEEVEALLDHPLPGGVPGGLYGYRVMVGSYPQAEATLLLPVTVRDPA